MPSQAAVSKASIWISRKCQCIYRNLALEDWIFRRISFSDQDGLLIWRNRPAVVIGRHQNPWVEVDVEYSSRNGINVARRQSGGGTVYHDLGNVNICVFTNKARHKRDENMRMLAKVLKEKWDLNAEVSKRHDLYLDGKYKISGTAAKLTHDKSYHHFTLMIDVNLDHLWPVLSPSLPGISSKATASVKSGVKTLSDVRKGIDYDEMVQSIVDEFRSRYQTTDLIEVDQIANDRFENVETTFKEFSSWQWIYGNTPPFTVSKSVENTHPTSTLIMHVEKGVTSKFSIDRSHGNSDDQFRSSLEEVLNSSDYVGRRFEPSLWRNIVEFVEGLSGRK